MCAIVDANVANTTVAARATEAGSKFLEHVSTGALRMVVGGQRLRDEITRCSVDFQRWLARALRAGVAFNVDDGTVDRAAAHLSAAASCASDDEHLVALAQVAGARLIFTNDHDLQSDCKRLLQPPAKIYTTNNNRTRFTQHKRSLLRTATCIPVNSMNQATR